MVDEKARSGVATAIVVGGGIAGLTLAWNLTRRGVAMTLFEQGPLPSPRASSYDGLCCKAHGYPSGLAPRNGGWPGHVGLQGASLRGRDRALGGSVVLPLWGELSRSRADDGRARRLG